MRKTIPMVIWTIFGLACVVLLFLVATGRVEGRTITVDDDGEAEFTSIQDAINASKDGDTVRVWDGVYEENVFVNRSLTLFGNGSASTIISARGYGTTMKVEANWCNVSGFMITESSGFDSLDDSPHGGSPGLDIQSEHNTISYNNCSRNGMAGIRVGRPNNWIVNNTCSDCYVGIYTLEANNSTIEKNICFNNVDDGIRLSASSRVSIQMNSCWNNGENGISLGANGWEGHLNYCSNNTDKCKYFI